MTKLTQNLLKTAQKPHKTEKKLHKITLFFILFVSYVYQNHIQEDWDDYNRLGKICIYPTWFIYSCLIWIVSPLLLPDYMFRQTEVYKQLKRLQNINEKKLKNIVL
jgi:hypothetical protein